MSQPQPGADRPADGSIPATGQDRDPAVTDPPAASPGHAPAPAAASEAGAPTPPDAPTSGAEPSSTTGDAETATTPDPAPGSPVPATATTAEEAGSRTAPETAAEPPTATTPDAGDPTSPAVASPDKSTAEADPSNPEANPLTPEPDKFPAEATRATDEPDKSTGEPDARRPATPAAPPDATAGVDVTPVAPVSPARGSAAVPASTRPAGTTPAPGRPDPTRVETRPEPSAPRWSGSAPVPPPPPRKRSWGESAEPTPLPPLDSPEHQIPVDPWEGVDTTGWDLHSADFPALPPTLDYPAPPHTRPYPAPPVSPPPAAHPPIAARPVSPPPPAPVSPPRPVPVPPPRPAPPAPAKPPKQRRRQTAPPVTTPPGFQPPKGYVAVPVRRRRRWPWVLLLTLACCCGVPLWWAQPLSAQYPASAALPDRMSGLRLREDERSQAAAERLKNEVAQAHLLAEDTFAGIYGTDDGKRVALFGGTGFRLTPEADADAEIARLREEYALEAAVPVETGVRGRYERCAVGRADGDGVVVCTSVDHGSLATGVFTRLSLDDSGRLLDQLRQQVVTAKQS
ncbi:hypothetical protein Q2K19_17790 [Micromonospora soli]|uniref:hypothetical protein n=1 Tax=Micromonospora sp. NBRC 110009 TaxID=3061627 RepID=UPI00267285D1|nr:hypothetical protein [Micromonospora sp. NBRC 110009]WKT96087.1 hypothetical protein Q2K19_17790 [Micromonospora sp. NBRC 110009]